MTNFDSIRLNNHIDLSLHAVNEAEKAAKRILEWASKIKKENK